ncbi:hypothetical protein IRJ41_019347 [Triplophysa rosa]|uniref:Gypsy retrotransposon integrase-like protein 1 n=1 Tax=Triplophysa rosa TaxID=992332 RepID=A0A9W7T4N9_TRIRA|nr:hypothetical protein IRJ41_019347 [Triplophysa rosa]
MGGAKFFTKLDASQGFWQLKLHEDSTHYCTFNTPFGRYSFLRMPFGTSSAPEVFHKAMEHMIEGIQGVHGYVDDIILWGSTIEQHNERLMEVLQRVQNYGLKLNKEKCQFGVKEITFLGDKLSERGVKPDQSKIQVILNMPRPTDKKAVQRVMGMINFIGKFIPNLSSKTVYMREMLQNKTEFKWTDNHESEWDRLKTLLTTEPVLTFFDPTKRIKISTDASKDGLGAVLLQAEGENWRPTDHKPLIAIIKKNLNEMSPRIQRLMMKLQRYDFDLIYTPGKYIVLADALSRVTTQREKSHERSTEADVTLHVNMVADALPVSDAKSKQIAAETEKDKDLQMVIKHLNDGWPRGTCSQYYIIRTELSVVKGLLLRQNRIVIPQSLRPDMMRRLHEGHLGAEKCKRRARTAVYWPRMNGDIDRMVSSCEICLKHQAKQQKEPMIIIQPPSEPWQKIGTDFPGWKELSMALLPNTSAACVIMHMKSIFARHGIPQIVCSDNGPCYSSKEFQDFAVEYDFKHVTSSPLYPQSNGKAEKGVHIVKQLLKKAASRKGDPYLALLNYLASPLEHGMSPAEILMGRKLRTTLPYVTKQNKNRAWRKKQICLKQKQKAIYDKTSRSLRPLATKDTVRLENNNTWNKRATVLEAVNPRSYTVKTEDGQILRRNRRSLLKTQETMPEEHSENETESETLPTTQATSPVIDNRKKHEEIHLPEQRRSQRTIKPPDRLNL